MSVRKCSFGEFVKRHKCISIIALIVISGSIILFAGYNLTKIVIQALKSYSPQYTETTDLADYGKYTGSGCRDFTQGYINSFFPKAIDDSFSNVKYSYTAETSDTYGFEAYLEFTIEDTNEFNDYISSLIEGRSLEEFRFDGDFMEIDIDNILSLGSNFSNGKIEGHRIVSAQIRKILFCAETQTIIYYALGVYDGGIANTDYMNVFFYRFDIDPVVYAQSTDPRDTIGPYEIREW